MVIFESNYLIDSHHKSIRHLLFKLLQESVGKHKKKFDLLGRQLLAAIESDREGNQVNKEEICSVCKFLKKIGYYDGDFKKQFLEYANEYYKKYLHSRQPIQDLERYTQTISQKISEEKARCELLFDEDLSQMLLSIMKKILIDSVITEILNSNFEKLLLEGKAKELKFYYEIMRENETFDQFLNFFGTFVKNKNEEFISQREAVIDNIFRFYSEVLAIVQTTYAEDPRLKAELDRSLEQVISKRDSMFAKSFASFISSWMERGAMQKPVNEVKAKIEEVMKLFRFIQNKKAFITVYNQRYLLMTQLGAEAQPGQLHQDRVREEHPRAVPNRVRERVRGEQLRADRAVPQEQETAVRVRPAAQERNRLDRHRSRLFCSLGEHLAVRELQNTRD